MLNMGRRDRLFDPKDAEKGVKPAFPSGIGAPGAAPAPVGRSNAPGPLTRDAATAAAAAAPAPAPAPPVSSPAADVAQPATAGAEALLASIGPDTPDSKLFVGINIKLKGVEITDCDSLVIEGQVEATVHSKAMEIAKPGTLKGNAQIDVAEIHGEFVGELTARTR